MSATKVAGAWMSATEFRKLVASCPASNPNSTPKKKGGSDRHAKGQDDLVRTCNRLGSLEDDSSIEAEASRTALPSSLSGSVSSLTK